MAEDVETVLYDVFLGNTQKKLYCIGPRLYNLKRKLFPLTILIDGRRIQYSYYQIQRLFFLESEPLIESHTEEIEVELRFRTFTKILCLRRERQGDSFCSTKDFPLTLSTLQKDNELDWIKDWILWHRRLFNVKRFILYDNGSSNIEQLMEFLSSLEPEVAIGLVDWSFPHGIAPYKSAQHGSLNHCRLKFSTLKGFCINLDVDEYLVKVSEDETLLQHLNRIFSVPTLGAIIVSQKGVPNVVPDAAAHTRRFFDFQYSIQPLELSTEEDSAGEFMFRLKYPKYIYRFGNVGYCAPHRTVSDKNRLFCRNYTFSYRLLFFIRKTVWKINRVLFCTNKPKPAIDATFAPPSELFFYHFLGLTTGWRGGGVKDPVELDDSKHKFDPLIMKLGERARIIWPQE